MRIITTPGELMDRGRWPKAAEMLGISEWAVNEGQMDSDTPVELTADQALRLGLLDEDGQS